MYTIFMPRPQNITLQWEAYEYYYRHKTSDWYWTVWIVAVSVSVASVLFGNIIFGALIIIATFSLSIFAARPPERITCEINSQGIIQGRTFYPYSTLESFNLDTSNPHNPKLLLRSKKFFIPLITVPLENVDTYAIKETLEQHIAEEDLQEPFLHKIMESLGF